MASRSRRARSRRPGLDEHDQDAVRLGRAMRGHRLPSHSRHSAIQAEPPARPDGIGPFAGERVPRQEDLARPQRQDCGSTASTKSAEPIRCTPILRRSEPQSRYPEAQPGSHPRAIPPSLAITSTCTSSPASASSARRPPWSRWRRGVHRSGKQPGNRACHGASAGSSGIMPRLRRRARATPRAPPTAFAGASGPGHARPRDTASGGTGCHCLAEIDQPGDVGPATPRRRPGCTRRERSPRRHRAARPRRRADQPAAAASPVIALRRPRPWRHRRVRPTGQQAVASAQQRQQRTLDEGARQLLAGGVRGDVDERAARIRAVGFAFTVEERHQHRALRCRPRPAPVRPDPARSVPSRRPPRRRPSRR